jgi:hypothetical protein
MLSITDIKLNCEENAESLDKDVITVHINFDKNCIVWKRNSFYNYSFLKYTEERLNTILKRRGWVTLNEIYDALGLQLTKDGITAGWVYNLDKSIDFGLDEPSNYKFIEGIENTVTLVCDVHLDIREFI